MAKTETAKATPKKAGKYSTAINAVKELSFDERSRLLKELNNAHAEDLNQRSIGQEPDGKSYDGVEDRISEAEKQDEGTTD